MKYNKRIVNECADWIRTNGLMEYGGAKLKDFLAAFGIDNKTYYGWMRKSEYSEAIKKAKEEFRVNLKDKIVKSLAKSATGYEYMQVSTEYENTASDKPRIKKQVKKNIVVDPNVGACIFLLTNLDPEHWKNRQNNDVQVTSDEWVTALKGLKKKYEKE